jgi:hypothetical protein
MRADKAFLRFRFYGSHTTIFGWGKKRYRNYPIDLDLPEVQAIIPPRCYDHIKRAYI